MCPLRHHVLPPAKAHGPWWSLRAAFLPAHLVTEDIYTMAVAMGQWLCRWEEVQAAPRQQSHAYLHTCTHTHTHKHKHTHARVHIYQTESCRHALHPLSCYHMKSRRGCSACFGLISPRQCNTPHAAPQSYAGTHTTDRASTQQGYISYICRGKQLA